MEISMSIVRGHCKQIYGRMKSDESAYYWRHRNNGTAIGRTSGRR